MFFFSTQVLKKASKVQSEKMNLVRVELEEDMEKDIRKRLNKIKSDLLGQHTGDLRSMVEKLLATSPSDVIVQIFDHCLELFGGKDQTKVKMFLNMVNGNRLARQLFQLALHRGCVSLVNPAMPGMSELTQQEDTQRQRTEEEEHAPVPPSEGNG